MVTASQLLVVEDDPRVGSFITQGLRDEGYRVEWTTTVEAAHAAITREPVDLVVLDHMLPDKSGIEMARECRARGHRMPILMLTARDAPEDRRAAFEAGASAFMSKPFRFDDLVDQIDRLLHPQP